MKKKFKGAFLVVAILGFILLLCLAILLIPGALSWVSRVTGVAAGALRNTLVTVAGVAIGGILISFGVTALAAVPIVGIVLVVVGLALLGYALYQSGWFSKSSSTTTTGLQKVA